MAKLCEEALDVLTTAEYLYHHWALMRPVAAQVPWSQLKYGTREAWEAVAIQVDAMVQKAREESRAK